MRWAGRVARCQAQPRSLSIFYSCNSSFTTLLLAARSGPTVSRRTISTKDEEPKGKPSVAAIAEIPEKTVKESLSDPETVNQHLHGLKPYPFERLKDTRPLVKQLSLRNLDKDMLGPSKGVKMHANDLLRIMAETNSPSLIWQVYQRAVFLSTPIPSEILDRVSRVLVRCYAPTRKTFLRLHEVLQHLRKQGHLKRWQWNSLIHHAALGMRKVHTKDYQAAFDVFGEMQFLRTTPGNEEQCQPDIRTYTTLLSIAIRTGVPENVEHAYSLLRDSNLPQDRIARLAIIPYYIRNRNLKAVREVAKSFGEANEDIGIDGINAYMWAFGRHGNLDAVKEVYQALRSNMSMDISSNHVSNMDKRNLANSTTPFAISKEKRRLQGKGEDPYLEDWHSSLNDVDDLVSQFATSGTGVDPSEANEENSPANHVESPQHPEQHRKQVNGDLIILVHHVPNDITYTLCIQAYAYHRNLPLALQVFRDLITALDLERSTGPITQTRRVLHKAYRALFLGLARQSHVVYRTNHFPLSDDQVDDERKWTAEALEFVFQSFLTMDAEEMRPNDRTVRWIMESFARTCGSDPQKLIWVWRSMEQRFGELRIPRSYRSLVSRFQSEEINNEI
ncbi:hypothetical protein M408DRAFT_309943 [Serendipita vermifera MAFF 305830]|uniref:Pentatricopeptide repeat protein n=1 Tax=Serendipita vermifera MAFF 305830 TaxID=933852 RepID=A0A0C3BQ05_SERVB|nr:hypothetical protein M408DRAFT_309943 [Serendipita vermifera MAFF 305830]